MSPDLVREARTFLFVPGDRHDRYEKAVGTGVDLVILDLEDAVAPTNKSQARERVAAWLSRGGRAVVRVNGADTPWFKDDLDAVSDAVAIMLPKTESAADVRLVTDLAQRPVPVVPLIETAAGVVAVQNICGAPNVSRVALGNVDLAADLGVDPTSRAALMTARSSMVYASRAAGLAPPVDGVTTRFTDDDALLADASHGRELGFGAKMCIHPRQVPGVARAFRPTDDEVAWAVAVTRTAKDGVGVLDGHMIDPPVVARAQSILRRAGHPSS